MRGLIAFVVCGALLFAPPAAAPASAQALGGQPDAVARGLYEKGRNFYLAHQNAAEAERQLSHAIARAPAYLEAYLLLGGILMETSQAERALALYEKAAAEIPGNDELLALRAEALVRLGRLAEAQQLRERIGVAGQGEMYGHWVDARLAGARGDLAGQEAALARALAAAPADRRPQLLRELAAAHEARGDLVAARARQIELLGRYASQQAVREYLAFLARHDLGAEELVSRGRGLVGARRPNPADRAFLAQGLLLLGKPEEAIPVAALGIAMNGPRGSLELLLARCQLALGRPREALRSLERAAAAGVPDERLAPHREAAGRLPERPYAGATVEVTPGRWDAGTVADTQRKSLALKVRNAGGAPLKILEVWVANAPPGSVEPAIPGAEIPPGGTGEVTVTVVGGTVVGEPLALATQLAILTNDLLAPLVPFPVTAQIEAMRRAVFATEPAAPLALGELRPGEERTQEFRVRNRGNTPLRVKQVQASPGVTYEGLDVKELAPGAEVRLLVRWRVPAGVTGNVGAKVAVFSDDTEVERNDILLTGWVNREQK